LSSPLPTAYLCLETKLSEHRYAVSRGDDKNGISVHANTLDHNIDMEGASVEKVVNVYWKRRTLETILIGKAEQTMNLYCGLHLSQIWNPILILITSLPISFALFSRTADEDLHGRNVLLSNKICYVVN